MLYRAVPTNLRHVRITRELYIYVYYFPKNFVFSHHVLRIKEILYKHTSRARTYTMQMTLIKIYMLL